jgi:hypothetical protein
MGAGASVCPKPLAFPFAPGIRAMSGGHKIVYTITDEAPMLATYAFLPIIKRFTDPCGITVEKSDISVAARVLAHFPGTICMHVCVCVCVRERERERERVSLCVCVCTVVDVTYCRHCIRRASCIHACIHVHVYVYTCMYTRTCVHVCIHVHVYVYTYITSTSACDFCQVC